MKNKIFILAFTLYNGFVSAQCYIQYTYDVSGNRIKHEYVGCSAKPAPKDHVEEMGNAISKEFAASRFGVRNGKLNPPLKQGTYTAKWGKMTTGLPGFKIGETPYFFHEHWGSSDRNYGCLAMMSGVWSDFKNFVTQVGWATNVSNLKNTAILNVHVQSTNTPIIKWK